MLKVLLVIVAIAALLYLFLRLIDRRAVSGGSGPKSAPRTIAPDDDADFLRDLEREKRRQRRDEQGEEPNGA